MSLLQIPQEPQRILGIGEAMVEFAPVEGGLFKRGFAGDTLNTSWYLRRLLPDTFQVSYVTRVGADALSNEFVAFVEEAGIRTDSILRDSERTLGLYTITLEGAERRFSYWRENSAARRLADDPAALEKCLSGVSLVYVSGITLAIIGERGRKNLYEAVALAKKSGARVAFDSNIRLRLWSDAAAAKSAIEAFLPLADVALPGFEDEALIWKDKSPQTTLERLRDFGVEEVVVKNAASAALVLEEGAVGSVERSPVKDVTDTTAAGDSFNAAYLAARCAGHRAITACKFAHELAGEVVRYRGALVPYDILDPLRKKISQGSEAAR